MTRMSTTLCGWLMCTALIVVLQPGARLTSNPAGVARHDPFEFFAPSIVVSSEERATLDRDRVVARTLTGEKGQVGVFVATRLNAQPDALVAWTHAIVELKQSKFVLAIGRFSDPPRLSDLDGLVLDDRDLDAIRRCRPGACGLKLSAAEIGALNVVAARAGAAWRDAVQREFRRLLVERVMQYRAAGLARSSPPADRPAAIHPQEALSEVIDSSPYLRRLPDVMTWLTRYPRGETTVESFFYWSKEHYGEGKPVISLTHVGIVRADANHRAPGVLIAGKQIFATHYLESALGLSVIARSDDRHVVPGLRESFTGGLPARMVRSVDARHARRPSRASGAGDCPGSPCAPRERHSGRQARRPLRGRQLVASALKEFFAVPA